MIENPFKYDRTVKSFVHNNGDSSRANTLCILCIGHFEIDLFDLNLVMASETVQCCKCATKKELNRGD